MVDRPLGEEVTRRETGMAGAYDNGGEVLDGPASGDLDADLGRIREGVEYRRALLGLRDQGFDLLFRGVRVDRECHLDVVEAVADVAVGAEDSADVVVSFHGRFDRAKLD